MGKREGDISIFIITFLLLVFTRGLEASTLHLKSGWNLLGSNTESFIPDRKLSTAKALWSYKDKSWYATSPNGTKSQALLDGNISKLNSISEGEGFWIDMPQESDVEFEDSLLPRGVSRNIELCKGWNLVALKTLCDINVSDYFDNENIEIVWKYTNNKWQAYSGKEQIVKAIDDANISQIDTIKTHEGFWVLSKSATKITFPSAISSLFVSLNGTDNAIGTIDDPLRTLQEAIDKAKELRNEKVNILLRSGVYVLDETITFKDVRSANTELVIQSYKDENVTLLGAKKITNWKKVTNLDSAYNLLLQNAKENAVVSNLEELNITNVTEPIGDTLSYDIGGNPIYGNELFVGMKPVGITRYPKNTFLHFLSDGSSKNYTNNHTNDLKTVFYSNNSGAEIDMINSFKEETNLYTYAKWKYDWGDSRIKITSIDVNKSSINLNNMPDSGFASDSVNSQYETLGFYIFNIASRLDENSYYIDYVNKMLYYYPSTQENNINYISNLDNIIAIENSSYIKISNLNFSMAKQNAINVVHSNNIDIDNCKIKYISGNAIYFQDVNSSKISNCKVTHIGHAGIQVRAGDRDTLSASNSIISNNNISRVGETMRYTNAGIKIYGDGVEVLNNTIYDLPHTGIYFNGNNHIIDGNTIHDVVKKVNDGGAIYAGRDWSQRGTIIENNFIYNILGENDWGAAGIYLDDMFCGTTVRDNVLDNTYRAILIGGGRDNTIDNNLIINSWVGLHTDARALRWYESDALAKHHMGYILNKVPWESELWQRAYPKLFTIYENSPRLPLGNKISNNRLIETEHFEEYADDSRQYLDLQDNNFSEMGTYTIKNSSDFNNSEEFKEYIYGEFK